MDEIVLEFSKLIKYAVDKEYTIKPGDTFWNLSQRFDLTVEDIQKANPDLNPNSLQEGQIVVIPGKDKDLKEIKELETVKQKQIETLKEFEEAIKQAAQKEQIPLHIFRGLVAAESSGNPRAAANTKSPDDGALGLTQLSPYARKALKITDPYDMNQNLAGGARWLRNAYNEAKRLKNIKATESELWVYALMIYHAGMNAVQKWINAGSPSDGFGDVGPRTIKYPLSVINKGYDPNAFSIYWPEK